MINKKNFSIKTNSNLTDNNEINKQNNKISSKIIPEQQIEKEESKQQIKPLLKSFISKKVNILKNNHKKYASKKEVFVFEESITQKNDLDNHKKSRNISRRNTKDNLTSVKISQENSTKNIIKNNIEKTFDKFKNKSNNSQIENDVNNQSDGEGNKTKERKDTYIVRQKPTFKELREKVLHRSNTLSVSTFY